MPTLRFAPSPTGNIHIGNTRTALINWLYCLQTGGTFILRFDDTDTERSKEEYANNIKEDLAWLGVTPHRIEKQSARLNRYNEVAEHLKSIGRLYPCYETADELDRKRKRQLGRGVPPVYDRAALNLTPEQKAEYTESGRAPHWRFLLNQKPVHFTDSIRGETTIDTASLSDPVLIREDGTPLYTFASVVDDVDMDITHIVRGEDHVANSAVQLEIFDALNAPRPTFAHHNLLTTASGEGLSKRTGALSVRNLREKGYEPETVASLAVLIGTSHPVKSQSLHALSESFSFSQISRAPAKFDPNDLDHLNARFLHELPFEKASSRLNNNKITKEIWDSVHENISKLNELSEVAQPLFEEITPEISEDDKAFLETALSMLPNTLNNESWGVWTSHIKEATGRKGKDLFMPLRKALTGREHGPDMKNLLPLIGLERAKARLRGLKA